MCQLTIRDGISPWSRNISEMYGWLDGGAARVGHFQFFGPNGWQYSGVNRTWGPGEKDQWTGLATGNAGDLWCARFWEGSNGNWIDITGPICVTG